MIGDLHLAIGLGMTGGRETWLNLEVGTELPVLGVVKLFAVVGDDGLRDAKPAYDRLPDEFGCVRFGNGGKGFCFYPLGEVINGDNRKLGLASAGGKWTN